MAYEARLVDRLLEDYLEVFGGVLLSGMRGCGKTETGLRHAASSVRLDSAPELVELAQMSPETLLDGDAPRLIDEWQLAPSLWNVMRHQIDARQAPGQFILSGSASPDDDVTRHTGAARFARLRMRTMSLAELGRSSMQVSLARLREQQSVSGQSLLSYRDMAAVAVRGGWPGLLQASDRQAVIFNRAYFENLWSVALPTDLGVRPDPLKLRRVLESLARNTASEVSLASIARDVGGDGTSFTAETARRYLDALEEIFAIEPLPAWSVALRSKSRLRSAPKQQYTEPALALAALGVGIDRLAQDPEFFGQVFEAMVIRDLRSLSSVDDGKVYHYRDNSGLEVDAIIEYPGGRWAACEVKLGATRIAEAERNLLKLRDERVDLARVGRPDFLAVVTATEYAYTLPSGVHVVPLGVLGA